MNRSIALTSLAPLALTMLAFACHPVDLGGDGGGGDNASGGARQGSGTGGDSRSETGGDDSGTGGSRSGTGGRDATGGSTSTSRGSGGSDTGSGGSAPAAACPTTVNGTLKSYKQSTYTPQGIAVDAQAIYWTASASGVDAGAVFRTDLATGVTTVLASAALDPALPSGSFDYPGGIGRSQGDVIWTAGSGGEVVRVPAAGGAASTLYHDVTHVHMPGTGSSTHTFTVDDTNVYWDNSTRNGNIATNFLLAAPLGGGGPVTTMATISADVTDPNAQPWLPLSLRVDGSTAFYTLYAGASTMSVTRRVGIDGQNGSDLVQDGFLLAPVGGELYQALDSIVLRQPESGGSESMVLGPSGSNIAETYQAIVVFGSDVYLTSFGSYFDGQKWTDEDCGWVKKAPAAGGQETVLWAGAGRPFDLAVDANGITWTDLDNEDVVHLVP